MSDDYRTQLQALLPTGAVWPRDPDSVLGRTLDGLAKEFARVDARAGALPEEADPRSATELLPDWERVAGLPDNCRNTLRDTLQDRRADLLSKITSSGGQSRAYFVEVAAAQGYDITIEEFRPFRAEESSAEDPVYDEDWLHAWRVRAPATSATFFRAGQSTAGEPLQAWGNDSLECRINQIKPAHTIALFAYGEE